MNINETQLSCDVFISRHNLKITGLSNINWKNNEHNIVYKIINNINNKYYIGQHITINPLDEYIGSGNYITKARHKYGLSSFTKEILFDFENFDDMNNKEIELVQLSNCWPYDQMSYNLMEGGHNGRLSDETKQKLSEAKKGEKNPMHKSKGRVNPTAGKTVLERFNYDMDKYEAWRKNNSESHKGKNIGPKNGMYGRNLWEMLDPETKRCAIEKIRLKKIKNTTIEEIDKRKRDKECRLSCENYKIYGNTFAGYLLPDTYNKWLENNSDKNRRPIPLDFCTDEQKQIRKQKLSIVFKGRIRIYDPITGKRRLIKEAELNNYLKEGWIIGYNCSSIGGKIAIHNKSTCKTKYIYSNQIELFLNNGWELGAYKNPNKQPKITIYNSIVNKQIQIDPSNYVQYYYDGWSLDLPPNINKGRVVVRNESTKQTKTISKDQLQQYLDDGWLKGRFPNSKPKTKKTTLSKFQKISKFYVNEIS